MIFIRELKNLKNCTLMGSFCPKHIMFQLENFRRIMTLKGDAKFKGKLTFGLKNNIRNLVNFYESSQKSENLHSDQILLSKANEDLDQKIQKSYISWQQRMVQSLNKNWLLVPKLAWGIWSVFTQPLKSPKISLRWAILSKVYKVWAQRSYLSWHWTVMQNWINPDLVVSKMA